MSFPRTAGRTRLVTVVSFAVVVLLVAAGVLWWVFGNNERRVTAVFTSAVGIYPGSDVRILGVPVGQVDAVTPTGKTVRITMSVQDDVKIPANVGAVQITPSVVSDRYVQLTPVYRGGPMFPDGGTIPVGRTATPIEIDQIYRSLNTLATALGPQGANSQGALSQLLNTTAANLDGNGQTLSTTLQRLGQLGTTLSGSSNNLFATLDNLQKFTSMLAADNSQVEQFNAQMQQVSGYLAGERQNLAAALANLAVALGKVQSFVRDNRSLLKSNVDQLNSVAAVLVREKTALNEALTDAPLALSNLTNSYNATSGTLDTRMDINELNQPPLVGVCKLLQAQKPPNVPGDLTNACAQVQSVVNGVVPLPTVAQTLGALQKGSLPPLPLPLLTGGGQR
jgi:virulence factor Mce-like protein